MALSLQIEHEFIQNSERVKSVDLHPTEPWILVGLYSGTISIWNYHTKIWNLNSSTPNFTLEGHSKGVTYVDYFINNDKQYLLSGSDDYTAKVWDYHTKNSVHTLEGHENNVTAICAHPEVPILITASEDGTVKIWDAVTYRLQRTLNFGLESVWSIGYKKGSHQLAFGCDKGFIMVKINCSSQNLQSAKQD